MYSRINNHSLIASEIQWFAWQSPGFDPNRSRSRRSYFTTDGRLVSQYVLVSSILVGLAAIYYFLSECCCMKFAVLFLWGAFSDERTGLQFAVQSLNGPSHSEPVTILYSPIWDSPNLEGQVPVFISPQTGRPVTHPGTLLTTDPLFLEY
jgi:hypothetical protein